MSYSIKENNNRVLVLDDEEDVLDFLTIFLGSLGWEVTTCSSPTQAVEEIGKRPYFLALTDIAMPEMDGYEFCSVLREKKATCEIALMTGFGYNPKHTLVKIRKSMQPLFFFKPFNRVKLAEGVQLAWNKYHKYIYECAQQTLSS